MSSGRLKMRDTEQTLSTTKQCKKAYHEPQLKVYGDLKDITRSVGTMGAFDGVLLVLKTKL
jgi:hypothetical protein